MIALAHVNNTFYESVWNYSLPWDGLLKGSSLSYDPQKNVDELTLRASEMASKTLEVLGSMEKGKLTEICEGRVVSQLNLDQSLLFAARDSNCKAAASILTFRDGANPNFRNSTFEKTGGNLFVEQLNRGDLEMCKVLLKSPKIKLHDSFLKQVIEEDLDEIAELLIEHPKMNLDDQSSRFPFALYLSCQKGKLQLVKKILEKEGVGSITIAKKLSFFHQLVTEGNLEMVKTCLRVLPIDLNDFIPVHAAMITTLTMALFNDHPNLVQELLADSKINPNFGRRVTSFDHETPLGLAVSYGRVEIVKILLADRRVNPSLGLEVSWFSEYTNLTPLGKAAKLGQEEIVKILLADPRIDPNYGGVGHPSPLEQAQKEGQEAVVALLLADQRIEQKNSRK